MRYRSSSGGLGAPLRVGESHCGRAMRNDKSARDFDSCMVWIFCFLERGRSVERREVQCEGRGRGESEAGGEMLVGV